jgi:hypothetical protein
MEKSNLILQHMFKKIELIQVTDPQTLKEKLEEMVNDGWGIKGFVNCSSGYPYGESYAVMERLSEREHSKHTNIDADEPLRVHTNYHVSPKKKEISISMGGN